MLPHPATRGSLHFDSSVKFPGLLRHCFLPAAVTAAVLIAASPALPATPVRSLFEQRTQHVFLQQFDLSCGAAALATVLKYQHGLDTDERHVALGLIDRDIYLDNPDVLRIRQGFSLLDMNRYVQQLGYRGEALGGLAYADLEFRAPAIVPIRTFGYNHFVVFRGERDGNVLLADPAYGNRTMPVDRFIDAWVDYAEFGRVAFSVHRTDNLIPPNRLAPTTADFSLFTGDAEPMRNPRSNES